MLKNVSIQKITPIVGDPKFVKKPKLATYVVENSPDVERYWEFVDDGFDTVHVLVNKTNTKELLLVKQVRIPVLIKHPQYIQGAVIEAAAGLIDKYPDLESDPETRAAMVASEEVQEEVGYDISPDKLVPLPTYMSSVGQSGSICYPYYCEVTEKDYVGQQLQSSEDIEVVKLPYSEIKEFLETVTNTDATTRNLLQWFLLNKV